MEATFHSYLTEAVYTMEREKCQRPESAAASGDQDQPVDTVSRFFELVGPENTYASSGSHNLALFLKLL